MGKPMELCGGLENALRHVLQEEIPRLIDASKIVQMAPKKKELTIGSKFLNDSELLKLSQL